MDLRAVFLFLISFNVFAINIDESLSGSWFDQNNPGQGINIEVLSEQRILVYWYTYLNGQPHWFSGLGQYDKDNETAEMELLQYEGGQFGINHDSKLVSNKTFGTLSLTFSSCDTADMKYQANSELGSGTIQLNRLTSIPGLPCTTPTTPFNNSAVELNDLKFEPGTCLLDNNRLTCEFSVTSLNGNTQARLFNGGGITDDGVTYRVKSTSFGSGIFASDETLTEDIPVTGSITYDEIPASTRMVDLLKIRFKKADITFDVDFFDVVIVNQN
ncbi:MAG: hypothetical protein K0U68_13950 [Gammaproteobacteria bacterium]|nr:hypothetical protein [Gammaproteobacteria bacterium]